MLVLSLLVREFSRHTGVATVLKLNNVDPMSESTVARKRGCCIAQQHGYAQDIRGCCIA